MNHKNIREINVQLATLLGVPLNATSATLHIEAGEPPTIEVRRLFLPAETEQFATHKEEFELVLKGTTARMRALTEESDLMLKAIRALHEDATYGGGVADDLQTEIARFCSPHYSVRRA